MLVYAGLRMFERCGGESTNDATMLTGEGELFIPTFSAAV